MNLSFISFFLLHTIYTYSHSAPTNLVKSRIQVNFIIYTIYTYKILK